MDESAIKPTETAAQHLVGRILKARPTHRVADVIGMLPGADIECADVICVVDSDNCLKGCLDLTDLFRLPNDRLLSDVMNTAPPRAHLDEDQERIATLARRYGLSAVPVVDDTDRLLGLVPARAIIDILHREHLEDMHRLAGIMHDAHLVHETLEAAPLRRLRGRLPWLLVGLVGSAVATIVMTRFEDMLARRVAIAFFVPAIVYLADAIGTQTEAIVVRYLSLGHATLKRLLLGELVTGLLIGGCLGLLAFPAIWLAYSDAPLACAVALSILAAGACATTIGLALPCLLASMGIDPAFGSGPLATVIQDVLSLLIYFGLALLLVL